MMKSWFTPPINKNKITTDVAPKKRPRTLVRYLKKATITPTVPHAITDLQARHETERT